MSKINESNFSSYLALGGIVTFGGVTLGLPVAAALGKVSSSTALSGTAASFIATATSTALWALGHESPPLKNKKFYIKIKQPPPPQVSTRTQTFLDQKVEKVVLKVPSSPSISPPPKREKRILSKQELQNRVNPSDSRYSLPLYKGEFCKENFHLAQEIKTEEKRWLFITYCLDKPTAEDFKEIETVVTQGERLDRLELSNVGEAISEETWEALSNTFLVEMVIFKDEWLPNLVRSSLERGEDSQKNPWVHWGDRYEVEPGKFVKMPGFGF